MNLTEWIVYNSQAAGLFMLGDLLLVIAAVGAFVDARRARR